MSEKKDITIEKDLDTSEKKEERTYKVLVNQEEQYALWPDDQAVPEGWQRVGPTGNKERCLSFVKESWTDMRPKSLRRNGE
jgi:MbtH protein